MSTSRQRLLAIASLAVLLLGSVGCTAARAGLQLQAAVQARDDAADREAAERAPYAFAMAQHYLAKAWEEAGHGENKASVQLAQKSMEWADQALVQIEQGPRRLLVDLESLDDSTPVRDRAPAPAPPPTLPTPPTLPAPPPEPAPLDGPDDLPLEGELP